MAKGIGVTYPLQVLAVTYAYGVGVMLCLVKVASKDVLFRIAKAPIFVIGRILTILPRTDLRVVNLGGKSTAGSGDFLHYVCILDVIIGGRGGFMAVGDRYGFGLLCFVKRLILYLSNNLDGESTLTESTNY